MKRNIISITYFVIVLSLLANVSVGDLSQEELNNLESIYNNNGGDRWIWKSDSLRWNFSSSYISHTGACNWDGISCDTNITHIIGIDLSSHNIRGYLNSNFNGFSRLKTLSLSSNKLTAINYTIFSTLKDLLSLDISRNSLNSNMSTMLSGITLLTKLQSVRFNSNKIYGQLPSSISTLSMLTLIDLSNNQLTRTIPLELFQLSQLNVLNLGSNRVSGAIPPSLGNLQQMVNLSLNTNSFHSFIPSSIGYLSKLQYLRLYQNSFIGSIPREIGSISSLVYLSLYQNSLTGSIPSTLAQPSAMYYLGLYANSLTGSIPAEIGSLRQMQFLRLYQNSLTGSIPSTICRMTGVIIVRINDNKFAGPLPECGYMPRNVYLDASGNRLTGTLPVTYSNLTGLQYLYLNNNDLSGPLPREYGQLSSLIYLRLDSNKLSSSLPSELSLLSSLQVLLINHNNLVGRLDSIFNPASHRNLMNIDISQNDFTGSLPSKVFLLPKLRTFVAIENCFHGSLPDTICQANQLELLTLNGLRGGRHCIIKLDFGLVIPSYSNAMQGDIPDCVFSLPSLQTLQISGNGFGGQLVTPPRNSSLHTLDLSNNKIRGVAHQSFQRWNFSRLDVSVNKISGTWTYIPQNFQENSTIIKLKVNRLSGSLPKKFKYATKLDVLSGNLFGCSEDLPINDHSFSSYVCGSSGYDLALILFAAAVGFNLMVAAVGLAAIAYMSRRLSRIYKGEGWYSGSSLEIFRKVFGEIHDWYTTVGTNVIPYNKHYSWNIFAIRASLQSAKEMTRNRSSLRNVQGYVDALRLHRLCAIILIVFILFVCLPLYPSLKLYINDGDLSTQSYQYTWSMSAVFISGFEPSLLFLLLWNVLVIGYVVTIAVYYSRYRNYKTIRDTNETPPTAQVVAQTLKSKAITYVLAIALVLTDIVLVLLVNGVFLYIQLSEYPSSYKSGSQFVKAVVDIIIGVVFPTLLDYTVAERALFMWWLGCMIIFNEVGAPVIITLVLSESCFKDFFVLPSAVETVYYFVACLFFSYNTNNNVLSCTNIGSLGPFKSSYTPSFVYNNRCSASLFTSYIPALIYSYVLSGYILPWFTVMIPSCIKYATASSYYLDWIFPGILWPRDTGCGGSNLFTAPNFMTTFIKDFTMLLTFGVVSPPLAVCVTGAIVIKSMYLQTFIGRYVHYRKEVEMEDKYKSLDDACGDSWKAPMYCILLVLLSSALFQAVVVLDMMTDTHTIYGGFWPCIVIVAMAVVLRLIMLQPCFNFLQTRQDIGIDSPEFYEANDDDEKNKKLKQEKNETFQKQNDYPRGREEKNKREFEMDDEPGSTGRAGQYYHRHNPSYGDSPKNGPQHSKNRRTKQSTQGEEKKSVVAVDIGPSPSLSNGGRHRQTDVERGESEISEDDPRAVRMGQEEFGCYDNFKDVCSIS